MQLSTTTLGELTHQSSGHEKYILAYNCQLEHKILFYIFPHHLPAIIVMTFWYVFWNGLNFFELFNFWDWSWPPCSLWSHDLCLLLFSCFISHMIIWPREVIIVLWSFINFGVSILWMHPHPHFLLLPLQPHHPYTPRLYQSTTAPLGEGHHPAERYDHPEDPNCTEEDFHRSRLGTAKVEWVLPSKKSGRCDGWHCQEPSPD